MGFKKDKKASYNQRIKVKLMFTHAYNICTCSLYYIFRNIGSYLLLMEMDNILNTLCISDEIVYGIRYSPSISKHTRGQSKTNVLLKL